MRSKLEKVETVEEAYDDCPWAAFDAEVEDGFLMFESYKDYIDFLNKNIEKNNNEKHA